MAPGDCDIGMIGLGVMGRNLALNIAEHGFRVAGTDTDPAKVAAFQGERLAGAAAPRDFAGLLKPPRAAILLVPAGAPVDSAIQGILPHLQPGDVLIDGGNSFYRDTELRQKTLLEKGIHLLGVGVSGGEEGARRGPSLMPGGSREAYERVRPIFEAAAARVGEDPCVAYLGPGGAGHFVKMVHNGIEYAFMQLLAESYDLLSRGMGLSDDRLHAVYEDWNRGELASFLVEITARIFCEQDPPTGKRLIDVILDEAGQKGTGKWVSETAMELEVPTPSIDAAVAMRNLSIQKQQRIAIGEVLGEVRTGAREDRLAVLEHLPKALYAGLVLAFDQAMAMLAEASRQYGYSLDRETVARIWRGGCIIRAALLEEIRAALQTEPALPRLLLDPVLGREVMRRRGDLQAVTAAASAWGIPVPGLMASLAYLDSFRSPNLPANLIQAQRDYFGAHTYERIDEKGRFHTNWE